MNKSIFGLDKSRRPSTNKNGLALTKSKGKTSQKANGTTTHSLDPRLPEFIRLHPIFKHHPIEKKFEDTVFPTSRIRYPIPH